MPHTQNVMKNRIHSSPTVCRFASLNGCGLICHISLIRQLMLEHHAWPLALIGMGRQSSGFNQSFCADMSILVV